MIRSALQRAAVGCLHRVRVGEPDRARVLDEVDPDVSQVGRDVLLAVGVRPTRELFASTASRSRLGPLAAETELIP